MRTREDEKFFKKMVAVWATLLIANFAFWGVVIYIILHFVAKYW